jgi:protein SCO1/2
VIHGTLITGIVIVAFLNLRMRTQRSASAPLPEYGALPAFALTERSGKPLTLSELAGNIWIADFIFTHCAGPCPLMTTRMARLEQSLKALPDVRLVSFTVDPARDTPQVLAKYADDYGASRDRWFFLTGEQATIYSLATNGFRLAVIENADGTSQPDHSTRFVLVDRRARIRGYYDGLEEEPMKKLLADIQALRREKF